MLVNAMSQTLKEFDQTPAVKKWVNPTKNLRLVARQ
ncbi:hypothetical protein NP493_1297g00004 [Ridgeia piscesae]|uniref:Uncharacterized protein n=1 Tax=Ridgeia piscesae TaxID=27915 RepID=A0AAD9KAK3_RIDPI|nr:hypothetical protein NP493_1297g00004 [Ridgeia piscesae]